MIEVWLLILLGFIWIIFASIQDLKSREVANWLNFSLIIFALGVRFFYSLFVSFDFSFFYQGLIGLAIFFVIGNLFYYGRFFAGGDAKLMIALGPILPFFSTLFLNFNLFLLFLFLFLFSGAFYGLVWSVYLMMTNFSRFRVEFLKQFLKKRNLFFGIMFLGILVMFVGLFEVFLFYFGVMIFLFPLLFIYAKSIDSSCMVKKLSTSKLTEGDWLCEKVELGSKTILPNWEGLSLEEIELLKKSKKFVLIKQGIPFVPVFLISYSILVGLWVMGFSLVSSAF